MSSLVRRPLNTAVVQGSAVTLQCSSDDSNTYLLWYNSTCVTRTSYGNCLNDVIYTGTKVKDNFALRFHVNNATRGTRDLNINPTQLTDAGVYLCLEEVSGYPSSSAQLIVLGNFNVAFSDPSICYLYFNTTIVISLRLTSFWFSLYRNRHNKHLLSTR